VSVAPLPSVNGTPSDKNVVVPIPTLVINAPVPKTKALKVVVLSSSRKTPPAQLAVTTQLVAVITPVPEPKCMLSEVQLVVIPLPIFIVPVPL
jgi:hypothetical protein